MSLRYPGGAASQYFHAARSAIYAYEREAKAALAPAEQREFKRDRAAWKYWEAAPPGYRKLMLHYVTSAKKPETRRKRFDRLVQACAAGQRIT